MNAYAYNMLADVYERTRTRNSSGQWVDSWGYDEPLTVKCTVRYLPIEGFSASARELYSDGMAIDQSFAHLRTDKKIEGGTEVRVGNIRTVDRYGRAEYPFLNDDGMPQEFVVTGEISKQDAWSTTIEWVYVLEEPES